MGRSRTFVILLGAAAAAAAAVAVVDTDAVLQRGEGYRAGSSSAMSPPTIR
jgi:hypothetical protein